MDQRSYLSKVDTALEGARKTVVDFVDHGIEMIRQELQHQHGARAPGHQGYGDAASLLAAARRHRRRRADFFSSKLFADPAWDILLELTAARLEHREVTVKVVQGAAMVPPATTLRWLHVLEDEDLIHREHDLIDRRRTIVTLTEKGFAAMSGWLETVLA